MKLNPLEWLEWLTRYGFIDILFGIGILGYIRKLLKKPIVEYIPGIEISRRFRANDGYFEIEVQNLSALPLYVYKAYFNRQYQSLSVPVSWFVDFYKTKFPKIKDTEKVNLDGGYLLQPYDESRKPKRWAFLEFRNSAYYCINIEDGENVIANEKELLETLIQNRECGTLTLFCVHGTQENTLKVRI